MPLFDGFCGPSYLAITRVADAEDCINLFFESVQSPDNAKRGFLIGTPGLRFEQTSPTAGCRGWQSQDNRTFTVYGDTLYEWDPLNNVLTSRGTVANDGRPVSLVTNGQGGDQLLVVSGGQVYVLDLLTNTLTPVTIPLTNAPVQADFIDAYFILSEADSLRVWFSALEDGTSWDPLDFFARSTASDNVVGIKVLRDKIFVLGSLTSELFYDAGDVDVPFLPYPGSLMQEGAITPWGIGQIGEVVCWLAQDDTGAGWMSLSAGDAPTRISTPAIENALTNYVDLATAEVLIYQQEGHEFANWSFPDSEPNTDGVTWSWDFTESQRGGAQYWHKRQSWNDARGTYGIWAARGICQVGNKVIVGDRLTTDVYSLSLTDYRDACGILRRLRRMPYLSAENQWLFLDQIELGIFGGVGLQDGADQDVDPFLMGAISRNSGASYDPPVPAPMGAAGEWNEVCAWYQCGRVRADRFVFEVTQTAAVPAYWGPGVWLRVSPGSGQR